MLVTCSLTRVLNLILPSCLAKFILDYSEITTPLCEILQQEVDCYWLEPHTAAFTKLKELMANHASSGEGLSCQPITTS